MHSVRVVALALAAMAIGCASVFAMRTPFDPADFATTQPTGTATISGQAFSKTRGGEVRYCAGETVHLLPDTQYVGEYLRRGMHPYIATDPRLLAYWQKTTGDGEGRFKFTDVGAGPHVIVCKIQWETGGGMTGGIVIKYVMVEEGEVIEGLIVH